MGVVCPLNPNTLGIRGVGFRAGHFFLFEVGGACLAKDFEARRGGLGICLVRFVIGLIHVLTSRSVHSVRVLLEPWVMCEPFKIYGVVHVNGGKGTQGEYG